MLTSKYVIPAAVNTVGINKGLILISILDRNYRIFAVLLAGLHQLVQEDLINR